MKFRLSYESLFQAAFAISPANNALLFKSKDVEGYVTFFTENYLKPEE